MPYISIADCKFGWVYRVRSRNLAFGVFDSSDSGFVGIREKGRRYLFTEYHWDTGIPFGTVKPDIAVETCPIADLRDYIGSFCSVCGLELEFQGTVGSGRWLHQGVSDCKLPNPHARLNQALFDYLEALERREGNPPIVDSRTGS